MALSRSRLHELPEDAIILTEDEALKYQWDIINKWKTPKDVWALKNTSTIIGACSALTGIYVNQHYRSRLKVSSYGKFSSYLPIVVIPAMFSILTHKVFVQRSLVLDSMGECPLCLQLRAATLQAGLGVAYPTALAPMAAFMFATRHFTYRLPIITEDPRAVFQLWLKFTKPIAPTLGALAVGHSLVAMYLTYKSTEQSLKCQLEMKKREKQFEHLDQSL